MVIRKVKVPKLIVDPGYPERPQREASATSHFLLTAGKILLILIIAYQVLQIMGKHVMKEVRERMTIDESVRENLLPINETLVRNDNSSP